MEPGEIFLFMIILKAALSPFSNKENHYEVHTCEFENEIVYYSRIDPKKNLLMEKGTTCISELVNKKVFWKKKREIKKWQALFLTYL